jgi:lipoate-protein ligase A
MERHRAAVESAIHDLQPAIAVRGHTDLVAGEHKFSGNSQRRRKRALLFHGTFLLNLNLPLVNKLLHMPSKQPDYRHNRGHIDFLTNLNLPAARLKSALGKVWDAMETLGDFPEREMRRLVAEKYSTANWNSKP